MSRLASIRERVRSQLHALRSSMSLWSLRRRVAVTFGGLAAVLAGLTLAIVLSLVHAIQHGDDVVNRWSPATLRSQALLTDMINQEAGVRGYALSSRIESLQSYQQYLAQEHQDADALRGYLHNRPRLQIMLNEFQVAVGIWQVQTAEPLIELVRAGDPRATVRVDSVGDSGRFDDVRARGAALDKGVRAELKAAQNGRQSSTVALVVALVVALLVVAGALGGIWRGLHRWVLRPVDRLAAQARAVATGHPGARIVPRGPPEFVAMGGDVEWMRQQAAQALAEVEAASANLARSNADLEQFAYVASHDLSEPLRKVANFCELLERQYADELDDRARQYIHFAVDGARRMQALIADLLALSRVGRTTETFVSVDTGAALRLAMEALNDTIDANGAGVGYSDLPTLRGDPTLIELLFENLLGNSIKYRSAEPPLIVVTAVPDTGVRGWRFTVQDNGIGIEARYAERVFAIFQRLHLRETYPGTGIGLALCRKIVEFHGGRIWLDTEQSGPGSRFVFTLPADPAR